MLTNEWRWRIKRWCETMPKMFYQPVGIINFECFFTSEILSLNEAKKRNFVPVEIGSKWGKKWEYCWFQGELTLPQSLKGERVMMQIAPGCDCVVFCNDQVMGGNSVAGYDGSQDIGGRLLTLTRNSQGKESYKLMLEGYAGHGIRTMGGGPAPWGSETIPEPPELSQVMTPSTFGIWEEELFLLWMDTTTLFELHDTMNDQNSLRVAKIAEALQKMVVAVDLELPRSEMLATVKAGREILKPILEAKNGSTTPEMYCFGHSHLDLAWMWPVEETIRKCARTFGSQLKLMEEYPFYKYLQSQAHSYRFVKEYYPEMYERIIQAINKGQWIADGALWVEPDMNISSGESIIRQIIHGKRFFREEFGVESTFMWLPDAFGYNGALPQIMKETNIDSFSTQKLFCCENSDGVMFPYNTFNWVGIDGSEIFVYLHNLYISTMNPAAVNDRWNERVQKDASHVARLMPYGHGDGGGGPTREHLEFLKRQQDLEGLPKCKSANPIDFFRDISYEKLPKWHGELYFQDHRGTYTSQAMTKKLNRKAEQNLNSTEFWGVVSNLNMPQIISPQATDELWKTLLFNQFHDILPGTSIRKVYERTERELTQVINDTTTMIDAFQTSMVDNSHEYVTVFNKLSFSRTNLIPLPEGVKGIAGMPSQEIMGVTYALIDEVSPCGVSSFKIGKSSQLATNHAVKITDDTIENAFIILKYNSNGEITSFIDKESNREFMNGNGNHFQLFKDVPSHCDAWNIDSLYHQDEIKFSNFESVTVQIKLDSPLVAILELKHEIGNSTLTQEIWVTANSKRVDFKTKVDWHEKHKLLKVAFPLNLVSDYSIEEIQFGHVQRPTHSNLPYDANQYEVCNHRWSALTENSRGFAILNDCKYGISAKEGSMELTLLKSALAPDMFADQGLHEFTYSIMAWSGDFASSKVVQEGYNLNESMQIRRGFAKPVSFFELSDSSIILETVKPAEDGSNDIIIRLYESMRNTCDCSLKINFPFRKIAICNMLEELKSESISLTGNEVKLHFHAFEIKTIRIEVSSKLFLS